MDAGAERLHGSTYNPTTLRRLETLKAGKATPFRELQKLITYDLAGNITGITDATNSNQTQTFGYDWLDRLTSATSAVGVGQYSHTYTTPSAISPVTMATSTYGSQPHAVTNVRQQLRLRRQRQWG